ncbi:hypothetical protein BH10BAC3_BH10BAC3_28420 [soil metagenome]
MLCQGFIPLNRFRPFFLAQRHQHYFAPVAHTRMAICQNSFLIALAKYFGSLKRTWYATSAIFILPFSNNCVALFMGISRINSIVFYQLAQSFFYRVLPCLILILIKLHRFIINSCFKTEADMLFLSYIFK